MNSFLHRYRSAIIWIVVAGFVLGSVAVGLFQWLSPAQPGTPEEIMVSVAGQDFTREQVFNAYQNLVNYYTQLYEMFGMDFAAELRGSDGVFRMQELRAEAAEGLIRQAIIGREARALRISVSRGQLDDATAARYQQVLEQVDGDEARLEQILAAQGMSLQAYKASLRESVERELREDALRRAVVGAIEPTQEEIAAHYEETRSQYVEEPEKVRIAHILVEDAALADRLLEEVRQPDADWTALAEEHSLHEQTREQGGQTELFTLGNSGLPAQVDRVAFDMAVGQVSLVSEDDGYHVIELLERREEEVRSLAEVRDEVREGLVRERESRAWDEWYRAKRAEADPIVREPVLHAFVRHRDDKARAIEILQQAKEEGTTRDLYVDFYLGRMWEALRAQLDARRGELEALEELTDEQQAELAELAAQQERYAAKALEAHLAFLETGEADASAYERVLRLDPHNVQARYRMATQYAERGEYAQAEREYRQVLERDPEFAPAHAGLADLAMAQGLYGRAATHYREALELQPGSRAIQVKLAEALVRDGDLEEARPLLTRLIEEHDDAVVLMLMGDLLMAEGDPEGALARYDTVHRRSPSADVQLKRGQAFAALERWEDARRAFRDVVRLQPYREDGYIGLGDAYRGLGDVDAAIEQYQHALRQAPGAAARETIARRIVALDPDDLDTRFRLAGYLRDQHKHSAAIDQYEAILERDPGSYFALLGIGDAQVARTEYDKALEAYDRALEVADTQTDRLLVYQRIVACEETRVGAGRPLTHAGHEALWQRAQIHIERGDESRARDDLQRIYDEDPSFRADELRELLVDLGGTVEPDEDPEAPEEPSED